MENSGVAFVQPSQEPPTREHISGVEYDENGNPIWYTVEEWFDELDKRLITHYGEDFRQLVNQSRTEWNKGDDWHFDLL
ncbi:MAG: hypothetical protein LBN37_05490 [Bacteroidales bacterium]|nr:hypothetical protein [Bacteroidales bacterium]